MAQSPKTSEALGIAVQMEQEGRKYYLETAAKMTNSFAGRMFLSLAEDERRHEQIFRQMALEEGIRPGELDEIDPEGPIKRIRVIFREVARDAAVPVADDIEALKVAMKMEEEAFRFYSQTAGELLLSAPHCVASAEQCRSGLRRVATGSPTEREILEKIALEENEHFRILDDTLLYLTDPVKWNLKEEKPLIDGG